MSTFTDEDLKMLNAEGNGVSRFSSYNSNSNLVMQVAQSKLMSGWTSKLYPLPEKTDNWKMKEFFKAKYTEKRFAEPEEDEDSDSSDDDKKKKKKKKNKDKKTSKRAKPKPQSESDEEEKEKDDSEGE